MSSVEKLNAIALMAQQLCEEAGEQADNNEPESEEMDEPSDGGNPNPQNKGKN